MESKWYIFWFQSMAGRGNAIPYNANKMTNWWAFTGDWDAAIQGGLGLQEPSSCNYLLSVAGQSISDAGGTVNLNVTSGSGCKWIGSSNEPWITVTSGRTGNGNGAVSLSVAANGTGNIPTGTVAIAGQLFTITQAATCPVITISPATIPSGGTGTAYSQTFSQSGGNGFATFSLSGTLPAGMSFSGATLSGTPTQSGSFPITITATDANGCTGGQGYTLVVNCAFSIAPTSQNYIASGENGSVSVTTGSNCSWMAESNVPWISLMNSGGSGSGTVNFTVAANPGARRTGTVTIAGQTFTVSQDAFGCPTVAVAPETLPNGFVGTAYNQTLTASGGVVPHNFTLSGGALPTGIILSTAGMVSGTPTALGTFSFTVTATDANGCIGTQNHTVIISGSGLQFYPLPSPVRALETRAGFSGCVNPGNPIAAGGAFTLPVQGACTGVPANAAAVTGNITVVPSGPGFLTLFPSSAAQPTVANSNFAAGEITNNVFTAGVGSGDGAFKIFSNATTEVIVDVTGYYAPPSMGELYFHPLPSPVRLLETRSGFSGCIAPGTPLTGTGNPNSDPNLDFEVQGRSPVAAPCNSIPASAQVLVGNATSVLPGGGGYLTIYPTGGTRPTVASSNYAGGDVINGPFAVKLGADGKFKIYTFATTHLVVDILGYYSTEAADVNGVGLLFNSLPAPVRLLETRPDFPGFLLTGCTRTNARIPGNLIMATHTQQAAGFCGLPAVAQAVVGNVSVVNSTGAGFLTLFPGNLATAPLVATSNYPAPATFGYNRHYFVGLSLMDGTFKVLTQFTTDLILDASGYFAP